VVWALGDVAGVGRVVAGTSRVPGLVGVLGAADGQADKPGCRHVVGHQVVEGAAVGDIDKLAAVLIAVLLVGADGAR